MIAKIEFFEKRLGEIETLLSDVATIANQKLFQELSKEHADLSKKLPPLRRFKEMLIQEKEAKDLLATESDKDLLELAREDLKRIEEEKPALEETVKILLVPRDPNDDKNAIMEIRSGTGGEEAALFAGELYRMYTKYAERQGWKIEPMTMSGSDLGGMKEAVFSVAGANAYGRLKFEPGVHRVQRVPATESQGRVHTSAATVAVMREAEDVEIEIKDDELRTDTFRAGGHGGQNVNKVETAVRITHIPSGVVVSMQDEKSQFQNRVKAMKILKSRLLEAKLREQQKQNAATRKSMVGSGDRSDKIRTYNFPQNRLTDHRIGYTVHSLDRVMEGDLEELLNRLSVAEASERLNATGSG